MRRGAARGRNGGGTRGREGCRARRFARLGAALAVLAITVGTGCAGAGGSRDAGDSVAAGPDVEYSVGARVVRLDAGDFVKPRFSPDGTRLAVSEVVVEPSDRTVEGTFGNTRILAVDVPGGSVDTLMTPDQARPYGYYASRVAGFRWLDPDRVVATILDGDVGGTYVTLDVTTGAITDERSLYPEEGEPLSPEERAIVDRLYRHHPEVEPTDNPYGGPFESGLHGHPLILGDSAVILQMNHAGYDKHVRYYSLEDATSFVLLELPDDARFAFGGGVSFAGAAAFAVGRDSVAELYVLRDDPTPRLTGRVPLDRGSPHVMARHEGPSGAWFLVETHRDYEEGDSPAYRFDGRTLFPVGEVAGLHDFDVHPDAGFVAYARWRDGRRVLDVRRLVPVR